MGTAPETEIIQLNGRWRISHDGYQWILGERLRGTTDRTSGYEGRKFTVDRVQLLELIGALCGRVSPEAVAVIQTWPHRYSIWRAFGPVEQAGVARAGAAAVRISASDVPADPTTEIALYGEPSA
jgi:hypothetical protein